MGPSTGVYEALALLGAGGMGRVYRGIHRPSGRAVALKTIVAARGRSDVQRLLVREAAAAAQLRHPNVVELLDFVVDDGRPFLVLELVEGHDAERWIDMWPGYDVVSSALRQVLDGLAVAHGAGILHRDLKPANLLYAHDGRIKITDFGMAELVDPLAARRDRAFGGTPLYMAPEQLDPDGHQGPWTDLYAMGVIAYVLLGGVDPVSASSRDWKGVKLRPPPFVPRSGLRMPRALVQLIESLIHPDASQRPRFAAEVRARFEALDRDVIEESVVSSGRANVVLSTSATADTKRSRPTELGSAATQMVPMAQAPTVSSGSSSSNTGSSREDAARSLLPPPLPELPFSLIAPQVIESAASLVRLRPPPLVARASEQKLCFDMVAAARDERRPQLLLLRGEVGVGKSRVARWLLGEVERLGLMEGTAAGYDVSGTSDGVQSALTRLFGSAPKRRVELPPAQLEKLEAWLAPHAPVRPSHGERVELAVASFVAASRTRPLLIWLDDVAWSRDGALEVALQLLETADAPIVIVLTLRAGTAEHPQVRARLEAIREHERVIERDVPRMDAHERRELLSAAAPLAPQVARELAELIDETPLLLVQLVQDLVESELLVPHADGFGPPPGVSLGEIVAARPPARLLGERIAKLVTAFGERAAEAEAVLIRAALLGQRFDERALRAAARGVKRRFVQSVVARSLLHGILRAEHGERYRFEHDLLREAMRARLSARADQHELLVSTAEGLLEAYGVGRTEIQIQAALLLHEAGEIDQALERLYVAATDLALLLDPGVEEQRKLARTWVDQAPTDRRRARVSSMEGTADYFLSRYESALDHLARGRAIAARIGDTTIELECMTSEAGVLFYQSRFTDSERVAQEALRASPLDDPRFAEHGMNAAHRLAEIAVLRADLDEAARLYLLALDYSKRVPGALREPHMVLAIAELELARGHTEAARKWLDSLAAVARTPESGAWRELFFDTELRHRVCTGDAAGARDEISARITELEQRGDVWRLTAFRVLGALAAVICAPDTAVPAVEAMLAAYATCSHEKPFTLWALDEIERRLADSALHAPASRVRALIDAQRARFAGSV